MPYQGYPDGRASLDDLGTVRGPVPLNGDGELSTMPSVGVGDLLLFVNVGLIAVDVQVEDEVRFGGLVLTGTVDLKRETRRHLAPDQCHLGSQAKFSSCLVSDIGERRSIFRMTCSKRQQRMWDKY